MKVVQAPFLRTATDNKIRRREKVAVVDSRMASSRRVLKASGRTWCVIGMASRTSAVNAIPVCAAVCGLLVGLLFLTTPSMTPASVAAELRNNQKTSFLATKEIRPFNMLKRLLNGGKKSYTVSTPIPDKENAAVILKTSELDIPLPAKELFETKSREQNELPAGKIATATISPEQWISKFKPLQRCQPWKQAVLLIFQQANGVQISTTSEVASTPTWVNWRTISTSSSLTCGKLKPLWTDYLDKIQMPNRYKNQICDNLQKAMENGSCRNFRVDFSKRQERPSFIMLGSRNR